MFTNSLFLLFLSILLMNNNYCHCIFDTIEFNIEPKDTVANKGENVLLECSGKSNGKIRWRGPDGLDIGIDTFRTQLANGSLYISSIEENRGVTGTYQCILYMEGYGSIVSRTAKVTVSNLPDIIQDSKEIYLYPGQTAYFGCIISQTSNIEKLEIVWYKDDSPLLYDNSRMLLLPSGSLEVDELIPSDRGSYQCNVTSGTHSVLSSRLNLNIKSNAGVPENFASPSFSTVPMPQIVRDGDIDVTFECTANGNPKPSIKWLKNGEDIDISDLDSRFRIIGTGSLQISSVEDTDSGDYQCRASNIVDSLDASASLQVQVPPKFIEHPTDKEAYEKDELEFVCSIHGKPTPHIQWLKNGDIITPNEYMQIVGGHNLKILGLISSDAGMFQCIGTNPAGTIQHSARLQIIQDISVKTSKSIPNHVNPKLLSKSVFESLLSNDKNKTIYFDKKIKKDSSEKKIQWTDSIENISYFSDPSTPAITRKTPYLVKQDELLSLSSLPGPPKDAQALIVKPRFVTLSWMEPLKNPDEVISYTVYYKMKQSERERKITTKSRDEQEMNIQSLLPGKIYQFRIVGMSNSGPGESSDVFEVHTQSEENIAGPPEDIQANALSSKSIQISWKSPIITNGIITKYRIYYTEGENGGEMYSDSTSLETILTELRPYTDYIISIVPFNKNGMGDTSNEIKVKTYSDTPSEPPLNVSVEVSSSTTVIIRWEPPAIEDQNGHITGYKIRYRKTKGSSQVETTPASIRHFEIRNLDRMSAYQLKIAAININGTGPSSEWHHIETYENDLDESQVPGPPGYIRTRPSSESISVHWSPPSQQEIKVRGYILGWGLGIPDEETYEFDENSRYHEISSLEPNSEYVISLRARNIIGDGPPVYDYVRTREDVLIEIPASLEVPVGLRAITMSSSSIVVYWTDTTLSKNQHVNDNRYYVLRYTMTGAPRYKYHNTTDLNCMIGDLKSNTQYEFAVKVVKGRRESSWSMSDFNSTMPAASVSPPRDLTIQTDDVTKECLTLQWQPPKQSNGPITGYIVFYTNDTTKRDRDWFVEAVVGDVHKFIIKNLKSNSVYYFKVQARTDRTNGPFSAMVSYKTPRVVTMYESITSKGVSSEMVVYIIIGISILTLAIAIAIISILCRKKNSETPDHCKKSYQKNNTGIIKPPDLWIHHDRFPQMELKNMEKSHSIQTPITSDGASTSGAMTLPRSSCHEFEEQPNSHITNSLDKRNYVPGYISLNSIERPQYPKGQYTTHRAHISMDPTLSQNSLGHSHTNSVPQTPENPYGYDSYSNSSYAPVMITDGTKRGQGHPLKSFSVPAPPVSSSSPTSLISNQGKTVPTVTIRPQNVSPYKKPTTLNSSVANRLQSGCSVSHSTDEIQRLEPSSSTEELNQEMANLEGLIKDLSAITANEFEC